MQRIYCDVALQFGSQVHPEATSDENSNAKRRSGQGMEKARDNPRMEFGISQERKGLVWKHKETKRKSTSLCHTDGHMSPQKMRS